MTFHSIRTAQSAPVPPAARGLPGPVTLALRAMRETVAPPIGPVTEAIRTMRAAVPDFDADPDLRALRRALADRIEADIAALDMLGGDPDAEPSLGAPEPCIPDGWGYDRRPATDQANWAGGSCDDSEYDAGDDREQENEHGTDEDAGESSLCGLTFGLGDRHDREDGDDTGIGDGDGLAEQRGRHLRLIQGGRA